MVDIAVLLSFERRSNWIFELVVSTMALVFILILFFMSVLVVEIHSLLAWPLGKAIGDELGNGVLKKTAIITLFMQLSHCGLNMLHT